MPPLSDEEQKLVFGDVLRTVYELKAEDPENRTSRKPIPEKIIFFVDELNKYAPAGVRGSPVLEQVLDITAASDPRNTRFDCSGSSKVRAAPLRLSETASAPSPAKETAIDTSSWSLTKVAALMRLRFGPR